MSLRSFWHNTAEWAYLVPFPKETAISVENRKPPCKLYFTPNEGVLLGIGYGRSGSKKL